MSRLDSKPLRSALFDEFLARLLSQLRRVVDHFLAIQGICEFPANDWLATKLLHTFPYHTVKNPGNYCILL